MNTLIFLIINSFAFLLASQVYAQTMQGTDIASTFKEAIELNETFKSSVGVVDSNELSRMRRRLEEFHENELEPAYEFLSVYLGQHMETDLLVLYFDLIMSFGNSADEGLRITLGSILYSNPDIMEQAFTSYDARNRLFLLNELINGWENVIAVHNYTRDAPEILRGELSIKKIRMLIQAQ